MRPLDHYLWFHGKGQRSHSPIQHLLAVFRFLELCTEINFDWVLIVVCKHWVFFSDSSAKDQSGEETEQIIEFSLVVKVAEYEVVDLSRILKIKMQIEKEDSI